MEHILYKKGADAAVDGLLEENTDYVVHFVRPPTEAEHLALQKNYGAILQRLHTQYYVINFGNYVGETSFCGKRYLVYSRKISSEQFEAMLKSISRVMATLPLQATAPVQVKVRSDAEKEAVFYHRWNSLRQALLHEWEGAPLSDWWELISREPHQRLESERVIKPVWLAKRIDLSAVEYLSAHPETWRRLPRGHRLEATSLAAHLTTGGQRYFPEVIRQEERRISLDTPENRMIKHILQELLEITLQMNQRLAKKTFFGHLHIQRDNSEMQQILEELLDTAWLREIGELAQLPAASTVLQNKHGYRQWYSFYQHSLLGARFPLPDEDIIELLEGRNIATLFEYWCFFAVMESVMELTGSQPIRFGRERNEDGMHILKDGLRVTFPLGKESLELYFNKTFLKQKNSRIGSYSQKYRPDISLRWRGRWHHFDAKFKYGQSTPEEGASRYVKKEDLDKMHTYKDAIIGTKSAWVLFPSDEDEPLEFFADPSDQTGQTGIGAIPLMHGHTGQLIKALKQILNGNSTMPDE